MGGTRNLALGRCAALLFLCGAVASLPTNALLNAPLAAYVVNLMALVSAIITALIPWQRLPRRSIHILVLVASLEVSVAVVVHAQHAMVFTWYYVLVAVFAAYAFRRRREAIAHLAVAGASMVATSVNAASVDPDALENALVGLPTILVAAGVVIWLRENLERRERTDPLTGLSNRRALMEALEETVECGSTRLLVLFDLDGFKRYNDQLGHAAGDDLLERLGGRLTAVVKGHGEAFRLGGDEFCLLLPDDARVPDCEATLREDGISASYGSAWLTREADTPSVALCLADDRMYAAKRASRGVPFVVAMESGSGSGSGRQRHPGRSPASARRPW